MKTAIQTISKADVPSIISSIPNGAIFTVTFIKKNGEVRNMNCRKGVTSHLTPNPKRDKPAMPSNMITVFDMQNGAYRHINTDTTVQIKAERQVFEVK